MAYRDELLAIANYPEIWFEFDPNDGASGLDGSGYGERGDNPALVQSGVAPTILTLSDGLPSGSYAARFTGNTMLRSGSGGYFSFAYFNSSVFGAWIKTTTTVVGTVYNFNILNGSTNWGHFRLDIMADGKPAIMGGSSYNFVTGPVAVNDGQWHFVCWRRTGDVSGELWVDGQLAGTSTSAYHIENVSGYMFIGRNGNTSYGGQFVGDIAHPFHYPAGLTGQQILDLYNAGINAPSSFRGWGIPAK